MLCACWLYSGMTFSCSWAGAFAFVWICVSAQDWRAEVPASLTALSGLCLTIPCRYHYPGSKFSEDKLTGIWYRGYFVAQVYNSKHPDVVDPLFRKRTSLVGSLESNECSLKIQEIGESDAQTYMFRIEIENIEKYTYKDRTVTVNITVTPHSPSVNCPGVLMEGVPVSLTCTTVHTCSDAKPTLSWSHINANNAISQPQEQHALQDAWEERSVLSLVPSAASHLEEIQCIAKYPDGQQGFGKKCRLIVNYIPKNVTVSVQSPVGDIKQRDTVILSCQSESHPLPHSFSWVRVQDGLEEPLQEETGQELTLPNIGHEPGWFQCQAENSMGVGVAQPISLNVLYLPVILEPSWCLVQSGEMLCECVAQANPPPSIHWTHPVTKDRIEGQMNSSESFGHQVRASLRTSLSTMKFTGDDFAVVNTTADQEGLSNITFSCVAENNLGSTILIFTLKEKVSPTKSARGAKHRVGLVVSLVVGMIALLSAVGGLAFKGWRTLRIVKTRDPDERNVRTGLFLLHNV
ncbi:sialic acid-binding Ig-like lectin 13 isoform X2 [Scleropages formosus]|uniref:sialic acid-binding Ig-like lectin 13 isoform X2 n=1 Tax=Scleropages formosus TaxID=113540 RepID=UPI0008781B04|nr:pregnancy-specific beta-1-glycoprotein 4 isoform X2 [Scleropages formosus]